MPGLLLSLMLALAACGGNSPASVIPTPAATAPPVVTVPPAAIVPATAAPSVATQPAEPSPTDAPATSTGAEYRVAFVAANDTLNVRDQPNAEAAVVTQLPAGATGIRVIDGEQAISGNAGWLPVETSAGDGWVNSLFLTEAVDPEEFCGDLAVSELLFQLEAAIDDQDGDLLARLVHPDRGLRLRLNWWNEEVIVAGEDVETLFTSPVAYDWGIEDGSGEAIHGSFSEIMQPKLERDLLSASFWSCDQGQFGGTAGSTALPEGYEAVNYYSAYRPAPVGQEMDWGTWLIGIERWEGQYYVSYLVHYRWEI